MGYRPFSTIRLAAAMHAGVSNPIIEVGLRVNEAGVVSYNLDDFPEEDDDLADYYPLRDVQKELPVNGRVIIYCRKRNPNQDFLNDYVLTLRDSQVVAVEGTPWEAPPYKSKSRPKPPMHKEARLLVHATVKRLLVYLRRSKRFSWDGIEPPKVSVSFSSKRKTSRHIHSPQTQFKHKLNFSLYHWMEEGEQTFGEYTSITRDPEIGKISGSWQTIVKVIVAHEVAHWAQRSRHVKREKGLDYAKPHGFGWQEIYRVLRKKALSNN